MATITLAVCLQSLGGADLFASSAGDPLQRFRFVAAGEAVITRSSLDVRSGADTAWPPGAGVRVIVAQTVDLPVESLAAAAIPEPPAVMLSRTSQVDTAAETLVHLATLRTTAADVATSDPEVPLPVRNPKLAVATAGSKSRATGPAASVRPDRVLTRVSSASDVLDRRTRRMAN